MSHSTSHSARARAGARRLAAIGIGLATAAVGTGCAAGQIAHTSEQVSVVDGAHGTVGSIGLRAVRLQYPQGGQYQAGQNARLTLAISNQGLEDDTLTRVKTDAARGTTFAPGSVTALESASAAPTESPTSGELTELPLPANQSVIALAEGPTITLTDLTKNLRSAQIITITFSFARAGDITLKVPVGTSLGEVPQPTPIDIRPTE